MALPTTTDQHHSNAKPQAPTPGVGMQGAATPPVGMQGAAPAPPPTKAIDPVLAEGIDPVLLHRLYPDADSISDVSARALEQGRKTMEEGAKVIAAQQEPPEFVR